MLCYLSKMIYSLLLGHRVACASHTENNTTTGLSIINRGSNGLGCCRQYISRVTDTYKYKSRAQAGIHSLYNFVK